jgi:hypothetical protein
MSEAETRFGVSPRLDKRVTYQPDVIVMEQGAEAIREPSTDGFTWTIDANAQGASDIEPGKIVFATGRVVGRVLKVARKGNNLDVTLGPVELTDVIQEAHIDYNGTIDPAKMIVYVAPPGYPGTFLDRDAPDPAAADTASVRRPSPSATIKAFTASRRGNLRPLHSGWADNRPTWPCAALPCPSPRCKPCMPIVRWVAEERRVARRAQSILRESFYASARHRTQAQPRILRRFY